MKVSIELDKHVESVHISLHRNRQNQLWLKKYIFILSFLNLVHKLANSTDISLNPGDSDPVDTTRIPKLHIVSKHCECLSYMNLLIFCLEILSYTLSSFSNSLLNNKRAQYMPPLVYCKMARVSHYLVQECWYGWHWRKLLRLGIGHFE